MRGDTGCGVIRDAEATIGLLAGSLGDRFAAGRAGWVERHADGEGRAGPYRRCDLDLPLVGSDELAGDEETETESLTCRALVVDAVEPVENIRQDVRGNPWPMIAHLDLGETIRLA